MTSRTLKTALVILLQCILAWPGALTMSADATAPAAKPGCCRTDCDSKTCSTPACCAKPANNHAPFTPASVPPSHAQNEWQPLATTAISPLTLPSLAAEEAPISPSPLLKGAAVPIFLRN